MLANGITLGYSTSGKTSFTNLTGLKEVPEIGVDPEKVDNTTLADSVKQYELGIGDAGELEYKFAFSNTKETDSYRVLRKLQGAGTVTNFEHKYPDGTKVLFSGQVSVKIGSGAVNGVIEFTASIALQSALEFTDPIGG
ncbi:phage tail tube protein [uncultured Streptococcus sp.]|uniref:phage tail tube protein n=1 Tax=uncultured Streptococcus sp. TaxID=83427 RepID=UPI00204B12FB|nr:phage tail tube protein [uncultured Streptococcus sp.]DAF29775.1 MAG TPA: tail tube protein [Caudoviricetes sp.]